MSVTTAAPQTTPLPVLRLLPAPTSEPPYDDELPPRALHPALPLGPLRELAPLLRLVPDLAPAEEPVRPRTASGLLPAPQPVARALVQGLLEVLAGVRPLTQLQRASSADVYADLERRLALGRPGAGSRPVTGAVRSVHVQLTDDGVAEVCATVHRGPRRAAVALRLEGVDGRWYLTALEGL